jgi:hypothetical protein
MDGVAQRVDLFADVTLARLPPGHASMPVREAVRGWSEFADVHGIA